MIFLCSRSKFHVSLTTLRYAYQKAWVFVLCIGLKWRTAYALQHSFILRTQVRRGEIQNVVFQRPKTYPKPVALNTVRMPVFECAFVMTDLLT